MRVLHINSGKLFGGVETMLVTLARCRSLCPEMTSEFAVSYDGRFAADLTAAGAVVHRLGAARIRHPLSVWRARRRLSGLLGRSGYDAIVCHLAWSQAIFGPVARAAGIPLVFWLHGSTNGKHWLERLASLVKPDFALVPSRFTAASLPNFYPSVPNEVLYNPVLAPAAYLSDGERLAVRKELDTPRDAVVIVQVGRMEEGKGQRLHLQALAMLRGNPRWLCWMIGGPQQPGEDSYFKSLGQLAVDQGIADRVRFLGQRPDVPRLLAAADLFCQPNTGPYTEGLPIVFSEALYAGLPVVATDMGSAREIIDEQCGRLVPLNNASALAATLNELISDDSLRRRLAAAGPARAHQLNDPGTQLERLRAVLSRISMKSSAGDRAVAAVDKC